MRRQGPATPSALRLSFFFLPFFLSGGIPFDGIRLMVVNSLPPPYIIQTTSLQKVSQVAWSLLKMALLAASSTYTAVASVLQELKFIFVFQNIYISSA